jgi:hypothetical protein
MIPGTDDRVVGCLLGLAWLIAFAVALGVLGRFVYWIVTGG